MTFLGIVRFVALFLIQNILRIHFWQFGKYSEILNKSTGTIEKNPPKHLAVRTFFAVLLAIIQEFEMLY